MPAHVRWIIPSLVFLWSACDQLATEPAVDVNLIANGNFEIDGAPSLQGWSLGNSQLANLVNEAPAAGGGWALELTADWAPTTGFAYAPVTEVQSGDIVQLSAFVRATDQSGGGSIELRTGETIWTAARRSVETSDTAWTQLALVDTLSLGPTDTVWVVLSSLHTEIVPRKGLFDLVTLKKMNSP